MHNELAQSFANYVQIYASGPQCCPAIVNSLFAVLMHEAKDFAVAEAEQKAMGMKNRVKNDGVWQAIFYALQLSDFTVREEALREINVVLIDK